jgi:hypothetical protein
MTNCIEYLHSSNSPINHDQLMKNNKSLTSSPYDDMDKVPIAEQKTKDSVGKENVIQHLLPEVLMMYFERLQDRFFFDLLW